MNSICTGFATSCRCSRSILRRQVKASLVSYSSMRSRLVLQENSDDSTSKVSPAPNSSEVEWRKKQLDRLEKKFSAQDPLPVQQIQSEDELQPMWQAMERRVKNRKSKTINYEQSGSKIGRSNIRKTDEDIWLQEGLYDDVTDGTGDDDNENTDR